MMIKKTTVLLLFFVLAPLVAAAQDAQVQGAYAGSDPQHPVIDIYFSLSGFPVGKYEDIAGGGGDATPFAEIPPGPTFDIGIAPATSTSIDEVFASFPVSFAAGSVNIAVGGGVRDPAQFAPNPGGRDIGLNLFVFDEARLAADTESTVDLAFFHGATDAPRVSVTIRDQDIWVDDATYGDFEGYVSLEPGTYVFDVAEATRGAYIASFQAELGEEMAGRAALVELVGFFDPAANQDGPPLSMTAVFASGEAVQFASPADPTDTETHDLPAEATLLSNYPNPFAGTTTLRYTLPTASFVQLDVYTLLGQKLKTLVHAPQGAGTHTATFDAADLTSGVYLYVLHTEGVRTVRRMVAMR